MDSVDFDDLTRRFAAKLSRRQTLRALSGGVLAALTRTHAPPVGAEVPAPTATGCTRHGKACKNDRQCCSGICRRKKCREAPNQGRCRVDSVDRFCGRNGSASCFCSVTVAGTAFCHAGPTSCTGSGGSPICDRDADCIAVSGPGSRCVRTRGGTCVGDRGCEAPCPDLR